MSERLPWDFEVYPIGHEPDPHRPMNYSDAKSYEKHIANLEVILGEKTRLIERLENKMDAYEVIIAVQVAILFGVTLYWFVLA